MRLFLPLFGLLVLPIIIYAVPKTVSKNSTATNSRYAYLTEYLISGRRNVRWETSPAVYVDANGKPVSMGNKGGSASVGCIDMQGHNRKNDEEYQRPNKKFFYKCTNGVEEVVACVGSDRANQARIKVGETLNVDEFWHKCESFENGSTVYTQEDACIQQDGKYIHVGDEVRVGFLRVICQSDGYKAVGCYYLDDDNNPVSMEKGTTKNVGKITHHCEDSGGDIRFFSTSTGCTKKGKDYNEGDEFKENHLIYKCENGVVNIKGCYIDDKRDLAIGKDVVDPNHMVYRCYKLNGAVTYDEYYCGGKGGGRTCKPEPIPDSEDEFPTLSARLKAPGYSSFSIVQKMGNDMVQHPETLKLELDKIFMNRQH